MVTWSDEHASVKEIAARLHCQPKCVRKWLHRHSLSGGAALADLPRSGRPTKLNAVAQQAVFMPINQPPSTFG
jgi:transposase